MFWPAACAAGATPSCRWWSSLVGSCLLRLVWIATIFRLFHTTTMLYLSYPVSWILTTLVHLACLLVVRHKMKTALSVKA